MDNRELARIGNDLAYINENTRELVVQLDKLNDTIKELSANFFNWAGNKNEAQGMTDPYWKGGD